MSDAPDSFALWAVFGAPTTSGFSGANLDFQMKKVAHLDVTVRGMYDVSGLRAGARLLVWLHGPDLAALQDWLRPLREYLPEVWNAVGVHRTAEFSPDHAPSFVKGLPPKKWVTVYPFVRSYDWYLLPDDERRAMLADHGRKGSEYPSVQANTVSSFALGDYEWILALEADDPVDLVDLMRHLRNTEARRHVREETPFFTGRLVDLDGAARALR